MLLAAASRFSLPSQMAKRSCRNNTMSWPPPAETSGTYAPPGARKAPPAAARTQAPITLLFFHVGKPPFSRHWGKAASQVWMSEQLLPSARPPGGRFPPRPPGASGGPSSWIFTTSSKVWMRDWFGLAQRLHIHHAPLGLTGGLDGAHLQPLGVFCAAARWSCWKPSRWAFTACSEVARPKASTIWLFHRGWCSPRWTGFYPPSACRCSAPGGSGGSSAR